MADDTKRKGPICFRMNQSDYKRFLDYVESQDVGKAKVAERAALDYLDEREQGAIPRYAAGAMVATVVGVTALLLLIALPYQATAGWGSQALLVSGLVLVAGAIGLTAFLAREYVV